MKKLILILALISTVAYAGIDYIIQNKDQDKDIIFRVNKGGTSTEALRIDGGSGQVVGAGVSPTGSIIAFAGAPTDGNGGGNVALGNFGTDQTAVNGLSNSSSAVTGSVSIDHDHPSSTTGSDNHNHGVGAGNSYVWNSSDLLMGAPAGTDVWQTNQKSTTTASDSHTHSFDVPNYDVADRSISGGSAAAQALSGDGETMPYTYAFNYIIKY